MLIESCISLQVDGMDPPASSWKKFSQLEVDTIGATPLSMSVLRQTVGSIPASNARVSPAPLGIFPEGGELKVAKQEKARWGAGAVSRGLMLSLMSVWHVRSLNSRRRAEGNQCAASIALERGGRQDDGQQKAGRRAEQQAEHQLDQQCIDPDVRAQQNLAQAERRVKAAREAHEVASARGGTSSTMVASAAQELLAAEGELVRLIYLDVHRLHVERKAAAASRCESARF